MTSKKPDGDAQILYTGVPTAKVELTKVTNLEALHALLDVQVSSKLKYPSFNLTGAARFVSDAKATTSSYTMVYSAGVRGKNATLKDPVLSRDALEIMASLDDEKIRTLCGDHYVAQVELGAQLLIKVRFDFANADAKSEFEAKIRFENLNLFEVVDRARVLSENAKRNAIINISALQVGGSVEKLLGILDGTPEPGQPKNYAVLECAIDNTNSCIKTLNSFLDYASNTTTGFASQLKNLNYDTSAPGGAAVLGYVTTRYDKGSASTRMLYEAPPPTIGAAVRDAREWLSLKYDTLSRDAQTGDLLLRLYLTDDQRNQIEGIKAKISRSTTKLLEVVQTCYSNLDACGPAKSELEATLQSQDYAYDPNRLTKKYTFVDYCRLPGNDTAAATTVDALKTVMGRTGEEDCLKIYEDLQATSALDLKSMDITDVRPLRGLTNVRNVNLDRNAIRNVSPLFELANLRRLSLRGNAISAVAGIETLVNKRSLLRTTADFFGLPIALFVVLSFDFRPLRAIPSLRVVNAL